MRPQKASEPPNRCRVVLRPSIDAVAAVGIGHHGELLVVGDQLVDQRLDAQVMAIVVAGAVDQNRLPLSWWAKWIGEPLR